MAITKLPNDYHIPQPVICAICGVELTLDKATAGLFDYHGHQAFACTSHLYEIEKLIVGWADFTTTQRHNSIGSDQRPNSLIYGGRHARLNS